MISVVGNSGVGKTTLAARLAERLDLPLAPELHVERPFHRRCTQDPHRYAFANQMDYLLFRAEQEADLRNRFGHGVLDGGLDLDYFGFTHLFHQKGYLSDTEFDICRRLYLSLRHAQPPPRVFVVLTAPLPVIRERFARRARTAEVVQVDDLPALQSLLDEWLGQLQPAQVMAIDAAQEDPTCSHLLDGLVRSLRSLPMLESPATGGRHA